ncbi:MAG: thioredoxin family protein [Anaerolineales bacterium]|nr:thioredoxin family protein [Anaerolineales bacterium]
MERITPQQRKAIGLGFLGLLLIVLALKFMLQGAPAERQSLDLNGKPALLFFNIDEPCECMRKMVESADAQINRWPVEARSGIPVHRINFEEQPKLGGKYKVFRVPCLVLVDGDGQIVHRQDYPASEGWPLKLEEFEAIISSLGEIPP